MKPYIEAFGKAIYEGYADLAFACFNEKKFIEDATETIDDLRGKLAIAVAALQRYADIDFYRVPMMATMMCFGLA